MKKLPGLLLIILCCACGKDCYESVSYIEYIPTLAPKNEVLVTEVQSAREIVNPERLYFKDHYVFLVESNEGIHVINNIDPAAPITEYFISIPGNHDVAIQNQYLYADNYSDLVVFDVSDIANISKVNRIESVFEYSGVLPIVSYDYADMIVTSYEERLVEENYSIDCPGPFDNIFGGGVDDAEVLPLAGIGSTGSGVGGSTARFTINNDFLYAVDMYSLRPFDLVDPRAPKQEELTYIGWDIETVFPYNDQLFIGSQSGMYIYDVTNPATPEFLSVFQHANACDPVVVQDNIAFVTLRDGTECQTFTNQLEIIDVSDLTSPRLIKTYSMDNPHGLGVQDNCLYICEGDYGLKQFDISDLNNIQLVNHFKNIHALDVIPLENNLMLIGEDGFHQYGGLCQDDIIYLSTIAF